MLFQKLASKNFLGEIRAAKDVEIFLERPTLLLGLHETSLQGIVDAMLQKVIANTGGEDINFEQARVAFFTHDSGQAKQTLLTEIFTRVGYSCRSWKFRVKECDKNN